MLVLLSYKHIISMIFLFLGYLPTKIVIKTITWKEISKKVRIGLQIVANYAQRRQPRFDMLLIDKNLLCLY